MSSAVSARSPRGEQTVQILGSARELEKVPNARNEQVRRLTSGDLDSWITVENGRVRTAQIRDAIAKKY